MATIFLTNGDDARTIINGGTYTIDALGGFDSLSFGTSLRSTYVITTTADGAVQVDSLSGASRPFKATLYNTELLLFDSERDRLEVSSLFDGGGSVLTGTDGDDLFSPAASVTRIDGGGGTDAVSLERPRDSVTLQSTPDGWEVAGGSDALALALRNVERLHFSDLSLALDLQGTAGTVARTLGVVFGPEAVANPVFVGIGLQLCDAGMDAATLMQAALGVQLGAAPDSAAVVTLLYTNLVGVAPDAQVLAELAALLDDGVFTPVTLALAAADTALNLERIDFTGLASVGLVYDAMPAG